MGLSQRTQGDECALVGRRFKLLSRRREQELGLATYLWAGEFLLDGGYIVEEGACVAIPTPATTPVPIFEFVLKSPVRVFTLDGKLLETRHWLKGGDRVRIEKVATLPWNHGSYVAGKIMYRGLPHWLIMSEVNLPKLPSHLSVVGQ
jgi:hypothetical protein